jgi:hypothetical protein
MITHALVHECGDLRATRETRSDAKEGRRRRVSQFPRKGPIQNDDR